MASIRSKLIKPLLKPAFSRVLTTRLSVAKQRANFDRVAGGMPVARGTRVEHRTLSHCPAEWLLPKGVTAATGEGSVLLYLHGGGYVVGSPRAYRSLVADFAGKLQCPALVPDYRLAPEQPYPAALDDAHAGWQYLRQSGYEPSQIVVIGDSAGGGLTAALLLKLRDLNEPMPAAALLISPLLDLTLSGASVTERQDRDKLLSIDWLRFGIESYSAGRNLREPGLSPLFGEPSGLPPLLIQVGTEEILYDDAVRFAARARRVGVEVQFEEWPAMWHDWHSFALVLPEARRAIDDASRWLLEHLAEPEN